MNDDTLRRLIKDACYIFSLSSEKAKIMLSNILNALRGTKELKNSEQNPRISKK